MSKVWFVTGAGSGIGAGVAKAALAGLEAPPRLFVAGGDALSMVAPAVEARLQAVHAHAALSRSTDGDFA